MTRIAWNAPKHNLQCHVEAFGLQEAFEAFCDDLESRFEWHLGGDVTYSSRTDPAAVSDELRERIADDNALDAKLYEFAKGLLHHR
jgi:hypothetical protein